MAPFARRRTRVVLGIAVLLAVLAALASWIRTSSLVRVEEVSVTGIDGAQATQIKRALQTAGRDMTTLRVRENALLSAVAAYPVVRSLRTETDFPHGLRIIVNAYEPVAAVRAHGGLIAVAGDGTLLRGSATRDLPVVAIRARRGGDRLGRGPALGAVRLLAAAPRALRGRVARVYSGPRGLTTTMENGPKLYFGGAARPDSQWGAAAQVLASSTSRGAAYVDLRIPERPVAGGLQPRGAETQPTL
ncbi:MAG: cell division protein FtsQ [Solirubrobacteraceae bacterium]|jgi:cell division septal protein FtsQ|nr:cell division protein FtsQ [Solirubrobacteraceae bacterium]